MIIEISATGIAKPVSAVQPPVVSPIASTMVSSVSNSALQVFLGFLAWF